MIPVYFFLITTSFKLEYKRLAVEGDTDILFVCCSDSSAGFYPIKKNFPFFSSIGVNDNLIIQSFSEGFGIGIS